jgi:hypothetical protein
MPIAHVIVPVALYQFLYAISVYAKMKHSFDFPLNELGSANPLFSTEDVMEANKFIKGIEAAAGESRDGMYVIPYKFLVL